MATVQKSSSITKQLQDIAQLIALRMKSIPLLSNIGLNIGAAVQVGLGDRSFQWQEEVREETFGTLNGNYAFGDGALTVVSSAVFKVGDIVHIKNHKDSDYLDVSFEVTLLIDPTHIAVSIVHGTDDTNHTTGQGTQITIQRGEPDMNTATGVGYVEPTWLTSYMQLFQNPIELGRKAMAVAQGGMIPGVPDMFSRAMQQAIDQQLWSIMSAILYGFGRAEPASKGATTKSISEFINTAAADNRIDGGGNDLDEDMINDALEKILNQGGLQGGKILVSNIKNARRISSLRSDKVIYVSEGKNGTFGGSVQEFVSEIPDMGTLKIMGLNRMDDNIAWIIDPASMRLVNAFGSPFGAIEDITDPKKYSKAAVIRSELGLVVEHGLRDHAVIYNLG